MADRLLPFSQAGSGTETAWPDGSYCTVSMTDGTPSISAVEDPAVNSSVVPRYTAVKERETGSQEQSAPSPRQRTAASAI